MIQKNNIDPAVGHDELSGREDGAAASGCKDRTAPSGREVQADISEGPAVSRRCKDSVFKMLFSDRKTTLHWSLRPFLSI